MHPGRLQHRLQTYLLSRRDSMMRRTLISYREGETNDPVGLNPQKASSYYNAVKPFTNPPPQTSAQASD